MQRLSILEEGSDSPRRDLLRQSRGLGFSERSINRVKEPRIVPRSEHGVSRRDIDPDALNILYRLHRAGHHGFLVGGGVRDLMLGRRPKDFDIATDARPRKIKRLFRNCRIIGRRFRLAHLHYANDKIIEVATFRSSSESDGIVRDGEMIRRDNVYGSAGEDAERRDLTVNALFYNIGDFSVIDYVGGVDDLRAGLIRTVNDPVASFREDPVRMLRAIRHGTRLDFRMEAETEAALLSERDEILKANEARMIEELYKDLESGRAQKYFNTLLDYGFLELLLPDLCEALARGAGTSRVTDLSETPLSRLDDLVAGGVSVSHAMGLAALFATLIKPLASSVEGRRGSAHDFFADELGPLLRKIRVYRRDQERLFHALGAWPALVHALEKGKLPPALRQRRYLRDAAEILALLSTPSSEITEFLEMVRSLPPPPENPRRNRETKEENAGPAKSAGRRRRRRRRRPSAG